MTAEIVVLPAEVHRRKEPGTTTEIIKFPGHKWKHCTSEDCRGCALCHGGLSVCSTCRGAEGSLPTDCPGEPMHEIIQEEVYAARLDYRRGEGWVQRLSKNWEGFK